MSSAISDGFDNPDMAAAIVENHNDRKEQAREERTKAAKDRDAILDAIQSETVHIRLKARRIEMNVLNGAEEDWTEDVAEQFAEFDGEEEIPPEKMPDYIEAREQMIDMLAEKSVEDVYDRRFWKQVPKRLRQEALSDLMEGGEEAARAGN